MNIFLQALLNVFGVGICILAICALQWAFFQWLDNFIPHPFKQTEPKKHLANSLYSGYNSENYDKYLNPCRQEREQDKSSDTQDYDSPPAGLFSSTFTHFVLLLDNTVGVIIRRLTTKCK